MNLSWRYLISLLILIGISSRSFSQIDNSGVKETDLFQYQPDPSEEEKWTPEEADGKDIQAETMTLFGSLKDIADNFPNYSVIPENRTRGLTNAEQKDVLVQKYWNGKDVSVQKIQTSLELGRYETNTKRIKIICRDHSFVDGDRVKLYVNEEVIRRSITLQGGYYVLDIELREGFNRIDIEALNQGSSGPNTAEFKVFDDNGNLLAAREWNILTGYVATMVVMKN